MLREEFGVGKLRGLQAAAGAMGQKIVTFNASRPQEIDAAFSTMVNSGAGALLVGPGPFLSSRRSQVITLAALNAIPTSYFDRGSVDAGGLISYGASQTDVYRRAGIYVARIPKGEKPGDLPVELPTKYELVINLKTAKALGLYCASFAGRSCRRHHPMKLAMSAYDPKQK